MYLHTRDNIVQQGPPTAQPTQVPTRHPTFMLMNHLLYAFLIILAGLVVGSAMCFLCTKQRVQRPQQDVPLQNTPGHQLQDHAAASSGRLPGSFSQHERPNTPPQSTKPGPLGGTYGRGAGYVLFGNGPAVQTPAPARLPDQNVVSSAVGGSPSEGVEEAPPVYKPNEEPPVYDVFTHPYLQGYGVRGSPEQDAREGERGRERARVVAATGRDRDRVVRANGWI